jgi:hypothetical protein
MEKVLITIATTGIGNTGISSLKIGLQQHLWLLP